MNLKLWKDYKFGKLNRKLTQEEQMEIDDCDFAMHLLLPTKSFLKLYRKLQNEGWQEHQIINILCMTFRVPSDIVLVKLYEIKKDDVKLNKTQEDDSNNIDKNQNDIKIHTNLSFWKLYKMGKLNRELYPLEKMSIDESDIAINELVPTNIFLQIYEFLKETGISKDRIVVAMSTRFKVPTDIIEVKIYEIDNKIIQSNGPKLVK